MTVAAGRGTAGAFATFCKAVEAFRRGWHARPVIEPRGDTVAAERRAEGAVIRSRTPSTPA
jgi:hypothetical protein